MVPRTVLLRLLLLTSALPWPLAADDTSLVISRFQSYLRINTAQPQPNYGEAAEFILAQARSLSLEAQTVEFVSGKPVIILKWAGTDPNLPSVMLYSHTDVVPVEQSKWIHPPFEAHIDGDGRIFARGTQDMKCIGMQHLEAVRRLRRSGFQPVRSVYIVFSPDEEIGGHDGAKKLAESEVFRKMNVGVVVDEGAPSPSENYRLFYGERSPWWLVIKATGAPGDGAKLYDNTAMENLAKSIETISKFRASQFDMEKSGLKGNGEVISVNMVYLKAGTPSPTGFAMNLQPYEAEAGFDIRVPPIADPEALERRIDEEWAPASRNMTYEFKQKVSVYNKHGKPVLTATDSSNPWWALTEAAVREAGGKLGKPEIFPGATDARYFRVLGLPAIGFSPIANTPILFHDHNEYLTKAEYLKGIQVYESIIKTLASYANDS
ncbi:hypothetical protein SAY86_030548 [Trapa natans]|uniref:N-acyl-aliphatic-L-amino acid amidohydrolase n=1 Tax=Trapa natans TaxID=22666 RepID=A0AAN7M567_TRANT|nr:hypothetical protein SAY86_030548 [Trapa natans]